MFTRRFLLVTTLITSAVHASTINFENINARQSSVDVTFYDSTSCAGITLGTITQVNTCIQLENVEAVIASSLPSGYNLVVYTDSACTDGELIAKGPDTLECFYLPDGIASANVRQ